MNLLDIRKKVVEISGRYDLVEDVVDYADNGIDFYIQEGQRHLERKVGVSPSTAKLFQTVAANSFLVTFKNCRSVRKVWIIDDDSRTLVTKVTDEEMKSLYSRYSNNAYAENPVLINNGRPVYYCATNLRRSPSDEDGTNDSPSLSSYLDTVSPSDPSLSGLVLMPPTDKEYTLEVSGLFYDTMLTIDTDENYWSDNYPMLLIQASCRALAAMFHGATTLAQWDSVMAEQILGIELDTIDQEIADTNQMEG